MPNRSSKHYTKLAVKATALTIRKWRRRSLHSKEQTCPFCHMAYNIKYIKLAEHEVSGRSACVYCPALTTNMVRNLSRLQRSSGGDPVCYTAFPVYGDWVVTPRYTRTEDQRQAVLDELQNILDRWVDRRRRHLGRS